MLKPPELETPELDYSIEKRGGMIKLTIDAKDDKKNRAVIQKVLELINQG